MNISTGLEFHSMVRQFMKVCIRRLSLRSIQLYINADCGKVDLQPGYEVISHGYRLSMPAVAACSFLSEPAADQIKALRHASEQQHSILIQDDPGVFLHGFSLAGLGALVLERSDIPLHGGLVEALLPIISRFNSSCKATMQHEHLSHEVNRRKKAEKQIEYMAYHDDLTGLSNRRGFTQQLDRSIRRAKETGNCGLLLYADLDNFRDINESLGYEIGDAMLKYVAARFSHSEFEAFKVSRTAGDSFGILAPLSAGPEQQLREQALQVARRVQSIIAEPAALHNRVLSISVSIGIVIFGGNSVGGGTLLAQGSLAMYQAKNLGRNTLHFFDPGMENATRKRLTLDSEMRAALREQQFELYLQPQVNSDAEIIGAEALIRWNHPERGLVAPNEFIPMAEKSGFIIPLSDWVIRQACLYIRRVVESGAFPRLRSIAVNLSANYFHQADFEAKVLQIVKETEADPTYLELELTERTLLSHSEDTVNKMHRLQKRGIQLSIDDFGTGYSSLAYLKKLPIDRIKIDRFFVSHVDADPDDAAIVQVIISMANHFNHAVIAEGVEHKREWQFLQSLGCNEFQGYYFHKPIPFGQFFEINSNP